MAADLVNSATSDKLKEMDWMKNIEVCELVNRDPGQAREVIKAVKKRLGSKSSNTQLWAVNLLEMLMNNCGEHIHSQVIDIGLLPIMVKIVKKKSGLPVREKIFLLLDAMQTSLGGVSGKFPQYYNAYFELVNAGVKFPRAPNVVSSELPVSKVHKSKLSETKPVSPKANGNLQQRSTQNGNHQERIENGNHQQRSTHTLPESSIIQKAGAALEVLRDVLDAIDTQNLEAAKDEFTLDLVEQCSFQKQRVMHIVMTSRDERLVSQAIELNEQLDKLLTRHDVLLSVRAASPIHFDLEEAEKEEAERLSLRIRKGKACMRPEDEELPRPLGLLVSAQHERLHRPLIRPLCLEPKDSVVPLTKNSVAPLAKSTVPKESNLPEAVIIPPPPAKHVEREKFFQEKRVDASTIEGNMRGLQLHSRNASSSNSGSMDSSD